MIKPTLRPEPCKFYPDEQGYIVVDDWGFAAVDGKKYTVPAGFWFNGGSIPSAFWQATFTPFDSRIVHGFLAHDWMYSTHCCDKTTADHTLQKIIDDAGLSVKGALVASAVFLFGGSSWKLEAVDKLYIHSLRKTIIENGKSPHEYGL